MGLSKTLLLFCYSIKSVKKKWKPEFPANEPVLMTYLSLVNSRTLIYIIFIVLKSLFNVCILGSPSEVNELEVQH